MWSTLPSLISIICRSGGIVLLLLLLEGFTVLFKHEVYVSASWFSDLVSLTQSVDFGVKPADHLTSDVEINTGRNPYTVIRYSQDQLFSRKSVRETPDLRELGRPNILNTKFDNTFGDERGSEHVRATQSSEENAAVLPQVQRTNMLTQEIAICHALSGLTANQRQICLQHSGLIWAMLEGTQLGLHECVHQFQHEQWNCSAVNLLYQMQADANSVPPVSGLEGILQRGSRETAFLSSAWSAGVVQAITRACSRGQMGTCDCDPHRREGQDHDAEGVFTWGGCSDPIKFGMRLTRLFLDASDKELWKNAVRREEELHGPRGLSSRVVSHEKSMHPRDGTGWKSRFPRSVPSKPYRVNDTQTNQMNKSNSPIDGKPLHRLTPQQLQAETLLLIQTKARSLMNLHNRRAGRRLVWINRVRKCKCHGVSGACSMRTCWQRVNEFRRVGTFLKAAYDDAIRVTYDPRQDLLRPVNRKHRGNRNFWQTANRAFANPVNRYKSNQPTWLLSVTKQNFARWIKRRWPRTVATRELLSKNKLIYLEESPNYCRYDPSIGHLGIAGRRCNASSTSQPNSCNHLCCDQGYEVIEYELQRKCDCKFFWCCEVKCKICRERVVEHRCKT